MKKKIISVVLVMTMVFALLAVSASAKVNSVGIKLPSTDAQEVSSVKASCRGAGTDVTFCGISILDKDKNVLQNTDKLTAGQVYYIRFEFNVSGNKAPSTGTGNDAKFSGSISYNDGRTDITLPEAFTLESNIAYVNTEKEAISASTGECGYFELIYKFTATGEETPTPGPTPTPDPDFDFDFSGLLAKILELIGWKKVTDDIKTVSILTIIFKIIEAIVAKLAAYIKN